QKHVASGRWEITGGWWIEPDSNLPLEISFQKQVELSQHFLDKHFNGIKTDVCFLPDTFGHPATLPKILSELGQKYFIFCRPAEHEKNDLPSNLFYWEYGGHRVLAYRLKHHYTQPKSTDETVVAERLNDAEYQNRAANGFFFGVGDHGGGPTIAEIHLLQKFMEKQNDMGFSTCAAFFKQAEQLPDIPTYSGDLHRHAVGCYSVMRDIKDPIRRSENGLCFTARALEMNNDPLDVLTPLWDKTLFNQFHDILPGSSSPDAADMARSEMGGVEDGWRTIAYNALKAQSATLPVQCTEGEFRIFNTLPYDVTAPLNIESFSYFKPGAAFRDEQGNAIEIQETLPSVRTLSSRRWEFIDTLPAQGFKSYHFDQNTMGTPQDPKDAHFKLGDQISHPAFTIQKSGIIQQDKPLLNGLAFRVIEDTSDTWGHGIVEYNNVIDSFSIEKTSVQKGDISQKLYERWTYNHSYVDVIYSLYQNLPDIYIDIRVNWAEDCKILKMELHPEGFTQNQFIMQGAGGPITRPADGSELPLHHWVKLQGENSEFAIIQNGAFACDCQKGQLRINLVRSNLYGYHEPSERHPLDPQHPTDQGLHTFQFRLQFGNEITPEKLERDTAEFLEPYWVIRDGKKPKTPLAKPEHLSHR
ncbi:MAG: hypothetical protein HOE48_10220, partial [Candidatus Latescibacteria bacterium]|nr:hypothetical protein [Candidatus Latescibacterota bacterium]